MFETYNRGNEIYFRSANSAELYAQLREYLGLEWSTSIQHVITLKAMSFCQQNYVDPKEKLEFSDGQIIIANLDSASRIIPQDEYPTGDWLEVIQLKNAQLLDEHSVAIADGLEGWLPAFELAPDPITGMYEVEVKEEDLAPLDNMPSPETLLAALETQLPYSQERDMVNRMSWGALFEAVEHNWPKSKLKEELEKISEDYPEDDSEIDLASHVDSFLLERDVAGFHLASPNTLQAVLKQNNLKYYELINRFHSTCEPDPSSIRGLLRLKQDAKSVEVRNGVWAEWQAILVHIGEINDWTAVVDGEPTERDELPVHVTNGDASVHFLAALKRWTGGSAITLASSKYGIYESHIRKNASLSRGVNSKDTNTLIPRDNHLLMLEDGYIGLSELPTLEELVFFENVLAAYY
jgi:hypothetical protein